MLNLVSKTTITQQSNTDFPSRAKIFYFDFVHEAEVVSSWQNLTDTAKLTFPKNIYFNDETGSKYTWQGKSIVESDSTPPILMRGDKIKIEWGYYFNTDAVGNFTFQSNTIFEGYISKIINRMPVEIECEDNMWKLKQIAAPNKSYPASFNLQAILTDLLSKTDFTVNTLASTNLSFLSLGDFRIQNETIAQVLDRIQKDYRIESYFRGNELRCSGIVYYPDFIEQIFEFQNNIIEDDLEYKRLDDIKIGVKVYPVNEVELQVNNSKGNPKKKRKRLEVFITKDGKGNVIETPEASFDGEKRTIYLWNITDKNQLIKQGGDNMNRLYYAGFSGKFTTFGLPFVRHGDHARLQDKILPERNGLYKIKQVTYTFGVNGFRQIIEPDLNISGASASDLRGGL